LSPQNLEIVKNELDYLLEAGIISRSNSNYASPIHLVPKKETGKFRLVEDYHALNLQTVPDLYPTPFAQSILQQFSGANIFVKLI